MVHKTKFDIVTFPEAWLKNEKHVIKYVSLSGHKFLLLGNRDENSGGGIGVYVKDCTNCKVRNDIVSIDETLDHLWIEVQGKNKRSPYLIRIVSQPSSKNAKKKSYGLKKIDAMPSSIKNARASSIILTGDTNIDLSSTAGDM